jgi:hypothetical protein
MHALWLETNDISKTYGHFVGRCRECASSYIDTVIFSDTWEEHFTHIRVAFKMLD